MCIIEDQRVYGSVSYIYITVVDTLGTLIEYLVFTIKNATTDILHTIYMYHFLLISLAILCSPILSNAVANDVHVRPLLLVTFLNQAARHS